jgi:collagenase-like PrtC family protease
MAMKLSLGPIPYLWNREYVFDFYARVAEAPVAIVCLGETICSKRRALRLPDWLDIAGRLTAAGKEVVLSTLTLIEAESEVAYLRTIAENGSHAVEANDYAAVNMLEGAMPFVIGPHINVYNARTLAVLAQAGAKRWVMPVELDRDTLAAIQEQRPAGLETEVIVFGRLPLSFSARCFTARAHNLSKDECNIRCADYPDGMRLHTREGASFLDLNGIQVLSARTYNLLNEIKTLAELKVDILRLIPQRQGMFEIIDAFHSVLQGVMPPPVAADILAGCQPAGSCNGYWHGAPGMDQVNHA